MRIGGGDCIRLEIGVLPGNAGMTAVLDWDARPRAAKLRRTAPPLAIPLYGGVERVMYRIGIFRLWLSGCVDRWDARLRAAQLRMTRAWWGLDLPLDVPWRRPCSS